MSTTKRALIGSVLAATVATGTAATALADAPAGPAGYAGAHRPGSAFSNVTVTNPKILKHFDLPAGDMPENIGLEPDGGILVNLLSRQVARIAADGTKTVLATLSLAADGGVNTLVV